jgi:class 3 adenylate cyclase
VAAAAQAQRALAGHAWPDALPVRVRMGIHTGEPRLAPPKYVGMDVHEAARGWPSAIAARCS